MLGFDDVYDYEPGKVDWLAHGLKVEGEEPDPPIVGSTMRDEVVRCATTDRAAGVLEAIERSPFPFAVVTSSDGVVLGRLPASAVDRGSDGTAGDVMQLGPSTVRPHRSAAGIAKQLAEKNLGFAIVTTPDGRLLGVASREALERASRAP